MDSNPVTKTVTSNVPVTETTFITPIFNKINDIYLKKSYLERYGGSVIFSIFAILIVGFYFIYLNIKNNKEIVKKDWAVNKCNPKYMPFAGMIVEPKDMSNTEYTIKNFSECSETILKDIIQIVLAPIEAASILISSSISILTGISKSLMSALAYFRSNVVKKQTEESYDRQTAYSSILTQFTAKIKSALNKGEGILATILFIFFSAYKAGASVFHVILWGEAIILWAMYGALIAAWVIYVILMVFVFTIPVAKLYLIIPVGLTVIYMAFMIMILVLIIFTRSVIDKIDEVGTTSSSDNPNLDNYTTV
jgi:hypothetical protein